MFIFFFRLGYKKLQNKMQKVSYPTGIELKDRHFIGI